MCLILFAWQMHADYPLVLAANRDEFYRRPTLPLAPWQDAPDIIGGRDLAAGGGWLACHADGRFAAVTNVRQGLPPQAGAKSRGQLITDYLKNTLQPYEFIENLEPESYDGFNLLLGNRQELYYTSNRNEVHAEPLRPGIYGLSNHRLDTPWMKVTRAKQAFTAALNALPASEAFFQFLADRSLAPDASLPQTGIPLAAERMLSAIFIASPDYGTRASTLLLAHRDGHFRMQERRFGANGEALGEAIAETVL
ncbi:hypothetical protein AGMMS49545_19630 [Betaproteobacteria bacterium]|nr:hypothetical protein AGMMS49545_19630 [Betaproteobacteria bacterium]GHU43241.1 hypothetical protein AGMMS50289_09310 [Betaproteobacteria bacterium]